MATTAENLPNGAVIKFDDRRRGNKVEGRVFSVEPTGSRNEVHVLLATAKGTRAFVVHASTEFRVLRVAA